MDLPYSEGTFFGVPLGAAMFATGLVARAPASGKVILCYFFEVHFQLPTIEQMRQLAAADAILVVRVGDLALMKGDWPIMGQMPNWERGLWPVPSFVRREPISGRAWLVSYSDEDATSVIGEEPMSGDLPLADDGVFGSGLVEKILRRRVH